VQFVIAHLIKITAHTGKKDELVEFLRWDADVAAADEPGTLRFDVYDVPNEPDAVYLYEAYAGDEAFAAHCDGPPFKKFVDHIVPNVIANMDVLLRSAQSIAANVPT
jgi:(4S)-4-hydroxy-5-phosphonooxypentane-2,3-dione isomerase